MVAAMIVAAVMAGCAWPPAGLSRKEWRALPPEKQAEYLAKEREAHAKEYRDRKQFSIPEVSRDPIASPSQVQPATRFPPP